MADPRLLITQLDRLLPGKPEEALEYCRELRSLALERRVYELLIQEEGYRGRSYVAESRQLEGRKTLSRAVLWYRERRRPEPGSLLINSVGADCLQLQRMDEARTWLAAAVKSALEYRLPGVLYKSLYNLGKAEEQSGNLAAARDYLERSLATARDVEDAANHRGVMLQSLASVHRSLGDMRRASAYLMNGRQEAQQRGQWDLALSMAREIADQMFSCGEFGQARELMFESLDTARQQRLEYQELLVSISLARVLFRLDQRGVLLHLLLRAQRLLEARREYQDRETAELYKYLAISYEKIFNDQERSMGYYRLYRHLSGLDHRER